MKSLRGYNLNQEAIVLEFDSQKEYCQKAHLLETVAQNAIQYSLYLSKWRDSRATYVTFSLLA